jgi:translation initiation factor IF-2
MSEQKLLQLPESISVRALADGLGVNAIEVIGKLIKNGVMATINQSIDYDTAALLVEDFGWTAEPERIASNIISKSIDTKSSIARPPAKAACYLQKVCTVHLRLCKLFVSFGKFFGCYA